LQASIHDRVQSGVSASRTSRSEPHSYKLSRARSFHRRTRRLDSDHSSAQALHKRTTAGLRTSAAEGADYERGVFFSGLAHSGLPPVKRGHVFPTCSALFIETRRSRYHITNARGRTARTTSRAACGGCMHIACRRRVVSASGVSCSIPPPHAALFSVLPICFTYEHAAPHGRHLNGPGPTLRVVCRSHGPH
jgi:hypothetical protein